jgi:hypothetical protein
VSPQRKPLLLFLLLLGLFPALGVVVQVADEGTQGLAWWQWGLLAAFPILVWIYLRHFSRLACRDDCLPPGRE